MNIAHVVDTMDVGGAEVLIAELSRFQRRQGHGISVHCLFARGALGEALEREEIPVAVHGPGSLASLAPRLWRAFRRIRPDVVHCHNATPAIYAALPARLAGARRVLVTRHGLVPPPYWLALERKMAVAARFCDAVVGVCDATTENLKRAPGARRDRILTVYNGAPEPPAAPAPAGLRGDFPLVHIARLAPAKDQATLLQAVALSLPHAAGLRLWLVGDGPMRPVLEQQARALGIAAHSDFYGEQKHVRPFLDNARLFVLSSTSEGLPVSLIEALAAGLPSVVTRVGAMPEVVETAGCGVAVAPSDPQALANAIVALVNAPGRCREMGAAARRHYLERFTLDHMAAAYQEIYSGLRP
jgi:glycosyltransferase involved in cell wall biosynthesis